jgi:hypothetical protein
MNAQTKVQAATLTGAMAAAFSQIEGATKSANNPHFKTKYADLTAVIEAIKPALIANDLFFTQHPKPSEGGVTVETVLHHAGGEHYSLGELFVPANKQDAQGFGSALTYARRYALVTAFGVPVEDDDGNAAARGTQQGSAVSPPQPISDADWALIVQLVEATGTDAAKVCAGYKVDSLKALSPQQFADLKGILEKRLPDKAKVPANA